MPWFCGSSKKRHSKAKVGSIPPPTEASTVTNGRPSFTVMLQDFNGAVLDELSAHRGQVLEALYTDKEWVYVRDIDGKCGYVPQTFCFALDTVNETAFQKNVSNSSHKRPRPVSLHLNTASVDHGSQNSVGVHHTQEQVDGPSDTIRRVTRRASIATPDTTQRSSIPSKPKHRRSPSDDSERNPTITTNSSTPDRTLLTPLSQPQPNAQRSTHRRSLSNDSQQTITNPTTLSITLERPRPLSQPKPLRPTHCRSLSSGSQRNAPSIITEAPLTSTEQIARQGPIVKGASSTSRLYTRRQSCPAGAVRSDSFKYTPYSARPAAVKRSVSMNDGGARGNPRSPFLRRSCSYKEAVRSNSEQLNTVGLSSDRLDVAAAAATERHSSSDSPSCTRKNCDCSKRPGPNRRRSKLSRQYALDYDDSSDDVFLPVSKEKKPYGIFRCLEDRRPSFKGEIALRKNELLIVLDHGRGQWAWAMTSQQVEGLVPKKLISRYEPDRSKGGVRHTDATTQTELVVSSDIRQVASSANRADTTTARQQSTASSASTNTARQVSSASSASGGPSGSISPLNTLATQTTAAQNEATSTEAQEVSWFSFEDSLERSLTKKSTPVANRRFPKSAPVTPVTPDTRQPRRLADKTDKRKSFSTRALSDLTQRGSPALTAAKDYEPPENTGGCLTLKKGDVLTPQLHMHYPKGWMWVWHSDQKRFGYVPNNTVVYTYPITRKARRTSTVEDEV